MTTEDYKLILKRGFRIIRTNPRMKTIQMLIRYDRWQQIEKFKTEEEMYRRFEILLQDEKTIRDI